MLLPLALTLAIVTTTPQTPPIDILSCTFVKAASFSRGVRVVYKNVSKVPATLVIFEVQHRSYTTALVDEGRFDPGQTVDHTMTSAQLTLWMGEYPTRCSVTHVHFADGSVWPK